MKNELVKKYLLEHRSENFALLAEFMRFPSISNEPTASGCGPCADWLAEHLRSLGFTAEVWQTEGQPCVFGELIVDEKLPTVLVYGHYDVQPPEPLDLWDSEPFTLSERDGWMYGRGINDNKGPLMAYIMAIDAFLKVHSTLPVNVKIMGEGEEETGSQNMEAVLVEHAEALSADGLVLSDTCFFEDEFPAITYGLRGVCDYEIIATGPNRDLHSGLTGGLIANPINALAKVLGQMHDETGRVTLPGFYDGVLDPTADELADFAALPFDPAKCAARYGVSQLAGGEAGRGEIERNWTRPTLECVGILGGYTGPGAKMIIPARASAKISTRLVPGQDPKKISAGLKKFVAENCPSGISMSVETFSEVQAVLTDRNSPACQAGLAAMTEAFGQKPVWIRCGASIGVIEMFQRIISLDAVMLGLPSENTHSPNERMRAEILWSQADMAAVFFEKLSLTSDKIRR